MRDYNNSLDIVIPARNEMFLQRTIEDILENTSDNTEVIAICDGYWPDVGIIQSPRVNIIHYEESIGQRAATNVGANLSKAKYICKMDAHCGVASGFDAAMIKCLDGHYDWTAIPRMYNMHCFDWRCLKCGNRTYQGPTPTKCEKCDNTSEFERFMVWQPRLNRKSDFMRFDSDMHFQYWGEFEKRPEGKGDICDLLCHVGACWMMHRDRYWELGGCDEEHGSWGQMGVEISCKTWLSGGRQVINKGTHFMHMFRTQGGDFSFPYQISGRQVSNARSYSKNLWMNNKWPLAKHDLKWLLTKFSPVPTWDVDKINALPELEKSPEIIVEAVPMMTEEIRKEERPVIEVGVPLTEKNFVLEVPKNGIRKGIVYYTDNRLDEKILRISQKQLLKAANGIPIISVSLKPIDFGMNVVVPLERGHLTMFKQQLIGLEAIDCDVVFFAEHDMLYHPSHFTFVPVRKDLYYFNENTYKVDSNTGQALFYYTKQVSGCCADRELLLQHYRLRVDRVSKEGGYNRNIGFEPGAHGYPRGIDKYGSERWMSEAPNIDVRHGLNLTKSRWSQDQFRNKNTCLGWKMCDSVPEWGKTKGRFNDFLKEIL